MMLYLPFSRMNGDLVLMDEHQGRRLAIEEGLAGARHRSGGWIQVIGITREVLWRKHSCLPRPHSCGRLTGIDKIVDAARRVRAPHYSKRSESIREYYSLA